MNGRSTTRNGLSPARILTCTGLVLAAAGILIQIAAGVDDYPRIPPGAILLGAAALIVGFGTRWWWTPLVAVVLCAVIIVGAIVTEGTRDRLADPGEIGPFLGTLIQVIGLILAVVAGIAASAGERPGRGGSGVPSLT